MFRKCVRNLVKKLEKTGYTCDRALSGRPRVSIEIGGEVHYAMTTGPLHIARNVFRNLDVRKTAKFCALICG